MKKVTIVLSSILFMASIQVFAVVDKAEKIEQDIKKNTKTVSEKAGKNVEYVAKESGKNIKKISEKTAVGVEKTVKKIDSNAKKKKAAKKK